MMENKEAGGEVADLLYGANAIAVHLSLRRAQVYHPIEAGRLPTFKIGGKVCARRSTVAVWLAQVEADAVSKPADGAPPRPKE